MNMATYMYGCVLTLSNHNRPLYDWSEKTAHIHISDKKKTCGLYDNMPQVTKDSDFTDDSDCECKNIIKVL